MLRKFRVKVSTEKIPHHATLAKLKLKSGKCLEHGRVMLEFLTDADCRLCMGRVESHFWHCWIEHGNTVIDLTRKQRFHDRDDYYRKFEIVSAEVERLTIEQLAKHPVSRAIREDDKTDDQDS
jgi:hypothetical protein